MTAWTAPATLPPGTHTATLSLLPAERTSLRRVVEDVLALPREHPQARPPLREIIGGGDEPELQCAWLDEHGALVQVVGKTRVLREVINDAAWSSKHRGNEGLTALAAKLIDFAEDIERERDSARRRVRVGPWDREDGDLRVWDVVPGLRVQASLHDGVALTDAPAVAYALDGMGSATAELLAGALASAAADVRWRRRQADVERAREERQG